MSNSNDSSIGELVLFGPFCLSPSDRVLSRSGVPIAIGGKALDILIALTDRAGEIVSARELIERVWPDVVVEEANLRMHIAALRRVLGERTDGTRYIINVSGRGYSIVAPIRRWVTRDATVVTAKVVTERSSKLPAALLSMVGRNEVVADLCAQLLSNRLVSIVGPGGIGKTTVAVAAVHALRQSFTGDGVYFIDLSLIDYKASIASVVAAAVGCSVPGPDAEPFVLAFLADKRVLILLDSCEHVIDAVASFVARLMRRAPSSYIFTTSREALRVEDEKVHLLLPLDGPLSDTPSAAETLATPAGQLFMETAASSGYRYELNDSDAPIVSSICRRLDGLALAIELAASWVGTYGVAGTADLLDRDAALQLQGSRSASRRHQTLQAMLDWSVNLLSVDERQALCALSMFVGEFTWVAARAVASDSDDARERLASAIISLVDKSLISITSASGPVHYRLLDTTRAYAAAILKESGREDAVAARYASYFAGFLREAMNEGTGLDGRDLPTLAPHLGNLRKALEWCFSDIGDRSVGIELAAQTSTLFLALSQFGECQHWCRQGISHLQDRERGTRRELQLSYGLARSLVYAPSNISQIRAVFEQAVSLSERLRDERSQLSLLADLNVILTRRGDFNGALEAAKESARVAERAGGPAERTLAEWMLGASYHAYGDQAGALRHCKAGFRLASRASHTELDLLSEARARFALARSYWLQGFPDRAVNAAHQTINEMAKYSYHVSYCFALLYTIPVFLWCGDLESAAGPIDSALAHATKYSLSSFQVIARAQKAEQIISNGDVSVGLDLLQSAYREMLVDPYHIVASSTSCVLAKALSRSGRSEEAHSVLDMAFMRADRVNEQCWRPDLLRTRGEMFLTMPEPDLKAAEFFLLSAMKCARRQSALSWELKAAIPLARMWRENDSPDAAQILLDGVYRRFTEGFGTRDLVAARRLLEGMAQRRGCELSVFK
jgi:predicted ATPase/DNA-binding winged helix-turn-helix (wHTH) protein